ncbi:MULTISPECIES: transcription antitermination factor NusB [unclassified Butyrivibrio]|jgi:N utilization substance protein B|uniref:transcription antitermination factor NusB n=1 Tax=unclassified Butyrivibrio TaxID=2639466 RepID=UPI000401766C|nr:MULTISPECIES: transcription antitermination factor NusB [unclassified Butyrivibrio]MCR5343006.1 transcription antitermination factor NusB [Butyrivibrio sp.]
MKRSELREQVFQLLFRVEFNTKEEMREQEDLFIETNDIEMSESDVNFVKTRYESIADKLPEIDKLINEVTTGWDTGRIGKVELAILRLAVYEIKFDDSIPTGVAINEAVELSKKFGQDGASSFVNGVLAKFA